MAKAISKKTVITNPRTRREVKIDSSIYEPFKSAILQSLKGSKGKTFGELTDDVVKNIKKESPSFKGSIPWYTISVLRDLETRGVVDNYIEKGKKMNRLKK
ncbi:MAG TPA: hypothetical protein VGQ04_08740 [Chitinophagaceae bacterium]|jgi:hypothetical protein|nr:hypothetical protein [Chitinophagaceae bacterium]